uniref:(northern house mosquito) hypothetical protein n=1 Tax=Culex pipiens TaxID=7175 RepID=A0A8D8L8R3_CULPI
MFVSVSTKEATTTTTTVCIFLFFRVFFFRLLLLSSLFAHLNILFFSNNSTLASSLFSSCEGPRSGHTIHRTGTLLRGRNGLPVGFSERARRKTATKELKNVTTESDESTLHF